jgi:hypothetical protein
MFCRSKYNRRVFARKTRTLDNGTGCVVRLICPRKDTVAMFSPCAKTPWRGRGEERGTTRPRQGNHATYQVLLEEDELDAPDTSPRTAKH